MKLLNILCIGSVIQCISLFPSINIWQKTNFIWNFGIIASSKVGLDKLPIHYFSTSPTFNKGAYQNIKKGDIVWVKCEFFHLFCKQVLPYIDNEFAIVIGDGDESFPSQSGCSPEEIEAVLTNKNIIHIFAQNYDYSGPSTKISPLPIGIDFHTIAYKSVHGGWGEVGTPQQQENDLKCILSTFKPTYLRKKRAFVDFQLADSILHGNNQRYLQLGETRTSIFQRLLQTGLIDHGGRMRRSELWKTKGQYVFSVSPHGNGLDCHRTWEDLALGCIVIVKTSSLDPLYEGLPVVIVKDWGEITEDNMTKWLNQYGDAFTNPSYREKLTNAYWLNKIKSKMA